MARRKPQFRGPKEPDELLGAAQQAWDRLHALSPNYPGLDRLKQSLDAARGSASGIPSSK